MVVDLLVLRREMHIRGVCDGRPLANVRVKIQTLGHRRTGVLVRLFEVLARPIVVVRTDSSGLVG